VFFGAIHETLDLTKPFAARSREAFRRQMGSAVKKSLLGVALAPSSSNGRPLISVIVPALNEESYIGAVINDMLSQDGLDADVEILVADGGSTDRTREIVREYGRAGVVRLVDNPSRCQAAGYNAAIKEARGTIVCIVHAHAKYAKNYLAACLSVRERTGATSVGGVIRHRGEGIVGEAIALAMSSPLGVGDSQYRHAKREQWCDSIMGAFLDREIFDKVGLYNESNLVNEDCEFNYRLRAAGYRIFLSPSIEATYYVRSSLLKLSRQYLRYGFFRRWTEVQHPGSVPLRVYAPPILVLGLVASIGLALAHQTLLAAILPALYGGFLALGFIDGIQRSRRFSVALLEPLAIATMHLAFGTGWLRGFLILRGRHTAPPKKET
jgi:succinoglycan biosynthesis protein ExoA